jgi:hypothetical protein
MGSGDVFSNLLIEYDKLSDMFEIFFSAEFIALNKPSGIFSGPQVNVDALLETVHRIFMHGF